MYILSQAEQFEKSENKIYYVDAGILEEQYLDAGYQRHERCYKIIYQYSEYTIICPEFRNPSIGAEPVVIIPDFLVPKRPYPIEAYLYAIGLYGSTPEMGQRKAAEATRIRFGLPTFAHTTLGRALKSLAGRLDKAGIKVPGAAAGQPATAGTAGKGRQSEFPKAQATMVLRKLAALFLRGAAAQPDLRSAAAACRETARKWYKEHQCFLL